MSLHGDLQRFVADRANRGEVVGDDIGFYADVDRETFYLICDKHGVYADDECAIFAGAYGLKDLL